MLPTPDLPHVLPTPDQPHLLPTPDFLHVLTTQDLPHALPTQDLPHVLPTPDLLHVLPMSDLPTVLIVQTAPDQLPDLSAIRTDRLFYLHTEQLPPLNHGPFHHQLLYQYLHLNLLVLFQDQRTDTDQDPPQQHISGL